MYRGLIALIAAGVVCLSSAVVRAQCNPFVERVGGTGNEVIYSSTRTWNGDIVMVGYTTSAGEGQKDLLLIRAGPSGGIVWVTTLGGDGIEEGRCVIETYDHGFVVTGYTNSFGGPQDNLLLAKFNSGGYLLWAKLIKRDYVAPEGTLDFRGYSVIEDSDHNLAVTGYMHRDLPTPRNSLLLVKFDPAGNYSHLRTVYNSVNASRNHLGYAVAEMCNSNGYLVAGRVEGDNIGEDILLVKFHRNGNLHWGWWIAAPGDGNPERVYSMVRTSDCGFVLTGRTDNSLIILRRNSAADRVWAKRLTDLSAEGRSVIGCQDSGFVVAGGCLNDLLIAKWDVSGALVWSRRYDVGGRTDSVYAAVEDPDHCLWMAGLTRSSLRADDVPGGLDDIVVAKCESDGMTCLEDLGGPHNSVECNTTEGGYPALASWEPLQIQNPAWPYPTVTHPSLTTTMVCLSGTPWDPGKPCLPRITLGGSNPFNPLTTIQYALPQAGRVRIAVYNILGQQVASLVDDFRPAGSHSVVWNATNVPSGMYFVQMTAGAYSQAVKLMVLK
ncbi:MAG: T9SS type A sorting domain-containing protein [bacterium]